MMRIHLHWDVVVFLLPSAFSTGPQRDLGLTRGHWTVLLGHGAERNSLDHDPTAVGGRGLGESGHACLGLGVRRRLVRDAHAGRGVGPEEVAVAGGRVVAHHDGPAQFLGHARQELGFDKLDPHALGEGCLLYTSPSPRDS